MKLGARAADAGLSLITIVLAFRLDLPPTTHSPFFSTTARARARAHFSAGALPFIMLAENDKRGRRAFISCIILRSLSSSFLFRLALALLPRDFRWPVPVLKLQFYAFSSSEDVSRCAVLHFRPSSDERS